MHFCCKDGFTNLVIRLLDFIIDKCSTLLTPYTHFSLIDLYLRIFQPILPQTKH